MKWLKKWSYLAMLLGMGIIYLVFVDYWKVYAEPLAQIRGWYEGLGGKEDTSQDMAVVWGDGSTDSPEGEGGSFGGMSGETESSLSGVMPEGGDADSAGNMPESGSGNSAGSVPGEGSGNSAGVPGGGSGNSAGEMPAAEPVYMTVEDDYFADAVFIGDSRTVGMYEYAGLEGTATFYASTGLTVYKLFDSEIVEVPGERKKITVEEALQQNSFAKIYLMIGINEMGRGTVDSFIEKYQEVVAHLQELQPDAIIYLQAIIKVTTERSNQGDYINNEGIVARNERIAQMADNQKIFYLDVNPSICDDTGGMVPEYTFDGVHLKAKYIDIWKDFLMNHAISLP